MPLNFPSSPALNAEYSLGTKTWVWNGSAWELKQATTISLRYTTRSTIVTSATSVTPDISAYSQYSYTALASGLTINAPIGTPVDGDKLMFRILDNGTSQTLTWNATYKIIGTVLPTATVANKTLYIGCIYNASLTRWDVIAIAREA